MPTDNTALIPVVIIAKANGHITFSVESLNLSQDIHIIEDTANGAFVNLSQENYTIILQDDIN